MAKIDATRGAWTAEIVFSERTLLQIKSGWPVVVANSVPTDLNDGWIWNDSLPMIVEAGQSMRFQSKSTATSVIYSGPFK